VLDETTDPQSTHRSVSGWPLSRRHLSKRQAHGHDRDDPSLHRKLESDWYEMTMLKTGLISATAAVAVLAGCASVSGTSGRPMEDGSAIASAGPSASDFNDTDIMFVQTMLPHHDQAVSMSDLMLVKRGLHPEVAALARQIKDAQQPEIETMSGWFEAMGRPQLQGGTHHGGLQGMLDENEMQRLDLANARDGQRLFLEAMIRHHNGAIEMANKEIADGRHSGAVDLAKNIATTQQQEIDVMTDLLTRI
jgi:uncharacterized protein (DUF305 family)